MIVMSLNYITLTNREQWEKGRNILIGQFCKLYDSFFYIGRLLSDKSLGFN